jgi:hypothetical protein
MEVSVIEDDDLCDLTVDDIIELSARAKAYAIPEQTVDTVLHNPYIDSVTAQAVHVTVSYTHDAIGISVPVTDVELETDSFVDLNFI